MKVLVLEDDPFLLIDLAELVSELGHDVVGPFSRLQDAAEACRRSLPEAAILDFNLGEEETSAAVADLLLTGGVPFVFTSGYRRRYLPDRFGEVEILEKPIREGDLDAFLSGAERAARRRSARG